MAASRNDRTSSLVSAGTSARTAPASDSSDFAMPAATIRAEQDVTAAGVVSMQDEHHMMASADGPHGGSPQAEGTQDEERCESPDIIYPDLTPLQWEHGWTGWSKKRRRAKMAQFIVQHLHKGINARWIDIKTGKFELNSWPAIAKEWYQEKVRGSDLTDATSILKKGLPRAFPDIFEVKKEAIKEGTQYHKRVFIASKDTMRCVVQLALAPEQDSTSSCDEQQTRKRKPSVALPQDGHMKKEPGSCNGSPAKTPFGGMVKKTKRQEQPQRPAIPKHVSPVSDRSDLTPGPVVQPPPLPSPLLAMNTPPSTASMDSFPQMSSPETEKSSTSQLGEAGETGYSTASPAALPPVLPVGGNVVAVQFEDSDMKMTPVSLDTLTSPLLPLNRSSTGTVEKPLDLDELKRPIGQLPDSYVLAPHGPNILGDEEQMDWKAPLPCNDPMDWDSLDASTGGVLSAGAHSTFLDPVLASLQLQQVPVNQLLDQQLKQESEQQAQMMLQYQLQHRHRQQQRRQQQQLRQQQQQQQLQQLQQQQLLQQQQQQFHQQQFAREQEQRRQFELSMSLTSPADMQYSSMQQQFGSSRSPGTFRQANTLSIQQQQLPQLQQPFDVDVKPNVSHQESAAMLAPHGFLSGLGQAASTSAAAVQSPPNAFGLSPGAIKSPTCSIAPSRSRLQGGERFFIIKIGSKRITEGTTRVRFYSPSLCQPKSVQVDPTNPYTVTGFIPSHTLAEKVVIFIDFPNESTVSLPFEYFDARPMPAMKMDGTHSFSDINELNRLLSMIVPSASPASGSDSANQLSPQENGQARYGGYCRLLRLVVQLDIRPLARLLLQLPAAEDALAEVYSDGKRLVDIAKECGCDQLAACLIGLESWYQCKRSGKECSESYNPLALLESSSSVAVDCVVSLCAALTPLNISEHTSGGADGGNTQEGRIVLDETSCGGNSADDENSECDVPSNQLFTGRKRTSSNDVGTSLAVDQHTISQSSQSSPSPATAERPEASGAGPLGTYAKHCMALVAPGVPLSAAATGGLHDGSSDASTLTPAQELIHVLEVRSSELTTENGVLRSTVRDLTSRYQQLSLQSMGVKFATALLKEKYELASQRRNEACKAMILAKNESRHSRRDAEKFESDYMDAMRQRDEALALCDRLNAERNTQSSAITDHSQPAAAVANGTGGEEDWPALVKKHEASIRRLEDECTVLKTATQTIKDGRDEQVNKLKSHIEVLEVAAKQSDTQARTMQDLQDIHYSMADELRNTKAHLSTVSHERDELREDLKMSQRESKSVYKRAMDLMQLLLTECAESPARLQEILDSAPYMLSAGDCDDVADGGTSQPECELPHADLQADQQAEAADQLEDLYSEHQELHAEYSTLQGKCASLSERLTSLEADTEKARFDRDWAIGEMKKEQEAREALKIKLDMLRIEKDQAIEESFKAKKEVGELQGKHSQSSEANMDRRPLPDTTPQTEIGVTTSKEYEAGESPPLPQGMRPDRAARRPQRRQTMDSRRSADDSALGSLDATTLLSSETYPGGNEPLSSNDTKPELYEIRLPPKGKDYGLVLESAHFIRDILPGSVADKEGKFSRGDLILSANKVALIKQLSGSDTRKLFRTTAKHGPLLACLALHNDAPSKIAMLNDPPSKLAYVYAAADELGPPITPKRANSASALSSNPAFPSPSLSARVAGKFGNISPVVNRIMRSGSTSTASVSISASDLQSQGRDYVMREGFEPGRCSRRNSLSSQSSCTYSSSVSNFTGTLAEDSVSQISQMDASQARHVTIRMQAGFGVGFKIQGGNRVGLFVTAVREDGHAQGILQPGDQLLKAGEHDLRHCSLEEAITVLKKLDGDVIMLAQFNPGKFQFIHEPAYDSFHLRCQFDYARLCDTELSFRRGDILRVVNSATDDDGYLAWRVNADGSETQLGVVPNMQRSRGIQEVYINKLLDPESESKDQSSKSHVEGNPHLTPYIHVERRPAPVPRPVLLFGRQSKKVAAVLLEQYPEHFGRCIASSSFSTRKEMDRELVLNVLVEYNEDNGHFSSTSVDGVREVAKQNQHCLLSIKPSSITQLCLADFQPIVVKVHTPQPCQPDRPSAEIPVGSTRLPSDSDGDYGDIEEDVLVSGHGLEDIIGGVVNAVCRCQEKPIWCEVDASQV